jgi:hypothetical protein
MVGNPSLIWLRQSCASTGRKVNLHVVSESRTHSLHPALNPFAKKMFGLQYKSLGCSTKKEYGFYI